MTSVQHAASKTSCANNNQTANALKNLFSVPLHWKEIWKNRWSPCFSFFLSLQLLQKSLWGASMQPDHLVSRHGAAFREVDSFKPLWETGLITYYVIYYLCLLQKIPSHVYVLFPGVYSHNFFPMPVPSPALSYVCQTLSLTKGRKPGSWSRRWKRARPSAGSSLFCGQLLSVSYMPPFHIFPLNPAGT